MEKRANGNLPELYLWLIKPFIARDCKRKGTEVREHREKRAVIADHIQHNTTITYTTIQFISSDSLCSVSIQHPILQH
ncbi:unnamed protein product [Medioppia subpectinata]|uniref:Uncharacterized protein n=1 Tax=Medioppia subpectinata TaxID=1979941 RepID=A0A7R9PVL0_9ACAR|nr:unnamed protein product [Medioppia subpectinata]CAG2102383.1 unnamed protein product [Medioppia subpectinata]